MSSSVRSFFKTSAYATLAQLVSLFTSIAMSLVLPKFISIESYGYWQLFLLYSSYIGILHFGFNDGVYLKLGGKKFDDIDKHEFAPQFVIVFTIQIISAILISLYSFIYIQSAIKQELIYLLSIYIVIENCYKIFGFTLMATDKMIFFSKTVLIDKLLLLFLVFCVIFNVITPHSTTIIISYIVTHIVALFLLLFKFRDFFAGWHSMSYKSSLSQVKKNMYFGITLTISNLLGSLILGSGRLFVEYYWDIKEFAKISLALSIAMFMLLFISQIGLVLFPMLRNLDISKQKVIFEKGVFLLGIIVFSCFLFFFPIYLFIKIWLPKYIESLVYLVFLFPISLYEVKFVMLYTPFFNTFNKQKILLSINVLTIIVAGILYYFACQFHNIEMIVFAMLIAIMLRSIVAQLYLLNFFSLQLQPFFYFEIVFSIFFIFYFKSYGFSTLFFGFTIIFFLIMFLLRKKIRIEFLSLREIFNY